MFWRGQLMDRIPMTEMLLRQCQYYLLSLGAKTIMITSLKKNDAGYLFFLTAPAPYLFTGTFYKVLCAAAAY
jgi:hypothetical protein